MSAGVLQVGDRLRLTCGDETYDGRYAGLSVDADDLVCLDYVTAGRRRTVYLGDITELRHVADDADVADAPAIEPPTRTPVRPLTRADNVFVVTVNPRGEEDSGGGDDVDLSWGGTDGICVGYRINFDEGFGMMAYVGWITKIELTTEEFLNGPPPDDAGG